MKLSFRVKCACCGKVFKAGSSTGKWCSKECYNTYRVKKKTEASLHTKICKQCGVAFSTTRNNKVFCSLACAKKACRKTVEQHLCVLCGAPISNNRKYCAACKTKQMENLRERQRKQEREIKCLQCGKIFIGVACNRKFCSKKCLVKWHNNRIVQENSKKSANRRNYVQCVVCGKVFFPKNTLAKCCSDECTKRYQHSDYYKKRAYNYNKQYRVEKHDKVLEYSRTHEARTRQTRAIEFQKNLKKFDIYPEMNAVDAVGRFTSKYLFLDSLGIIRITENKCKCEKCGNTFLIGSGKKGQGLSFLQRRQRINKSPCPYCGDAPVGIRRNSTYEAEIQRLYPQFEINAKPEWFSYLDSRSFKPIQLELDLYNEQKGIALEFNGIVWHSSRFEKDPNSLAKKTDICEKNAVQLIHVWEYEWKDAKVQVLNVLNKILDHDFAVITSKDLKIREICKDREIREITKFGNENNVIPSKGFSWGCILTDSNENIVASAEFYQSGHDWILGRYTEKSGFLIREGLKKILMSFWRSHPDVREICAYANRRWIYRKKNIYLEAGFKEVEILNPDFVYTDLNIRHNPIKDKDLSNKDGWYRLYDAGYIKYQVSRKNKRL